MLFVEKNSPPEQIASSILYDLLEFHSNNLVFRFYRETRPNHHFSWHLPKFHIYRHFRMRHLFVNICIRWNWECQFFTHFISFTLLWSSYLRQRHYLHIHTFGFDTREILVVQLYLPEFRSRLTPTKTDIDWERLMMHWKLQGTTR